MFFFKGLIINPIFKLEYCSISSEKRTRARLLKRLRLGAFPYFLLTIKYFNENQIEHQAMSRSDLDYTKFKNIFFFLKYNMAAIDTVINCAGYVGKPNVDACEKEKGESKE